MKVLFDTNVLLDVQLQRPYSFATSNKLWKANSKRLVQGYITASSVRDIHYMVNKEKGAVRALQAVVLCLAEFRVCPIDHNILNQAAKSSGPDFEDNIQIAAALAEGLDAIVTSNIKDFRGAGIKLYTPAQLVKELKLR